MTGVIIGRFMPPHSGHVFLFDFARSMCDELYIFVCTLAHEPIPGTKRYEWVRELAPESTVIHITEEIPAARRDATGAVVIWAETIRGHVPKPIEYVFASEQYGFELAEILGARFVPVDPDRRNIPVSASIIRERPYAHWRYIPPPVRPYYVRHLVVIDESRLARSLADALDTVVVGSYGEFWRLTWNEYGGRGEAPSLSPDEIERGELATITALSRHANRILVYDIAGPRDMARLPRVDLVVARHTYLEAIQEQVSGDSPLVIQPEGIRAEEIARVLLETN
jgi:NadR type nicotinamide-nucleotide adenylyltransferase